MPMKLLKKYYVYVIQKNSKLKLYNVILQNVNKRVKLNKKAIIGSFESFEIFESFVDYTKLINNF